jgi:hypothetical protein
MYEEWAFQLFPGFHFEDVMTAVNNLGNKASMKNYLERLREEELDRYLVYTFKLYHFYVHNINMLFYM